MNVKKIKKIIKRISIEFSIILVLSAAINCGLYILRGQIGNSDAGDRVREQLEIERGLTKGLEEQIAALQSERDSYAERVRNLDKASSELEDSSGRLQEIRRSNAGNNRELENDIESLERVFEGDREKISRLSDLLQEKDS